MVRSDTNYDIVLIGAGIMSATLGVLVHELMPDLRIAIYERLDKVGAESSAAWNNAGTGHSGFCELNYTPVLENGTVDISKALSIGAAFEVSKQFWAYLKEMHHLPDAHLFINDIDHMSFVIGEENVQFLKERYKAMQPYALFEDMLYTEDHAQIMEWIPLMMEGRDPNQKIAATRMEIGTDVNFGAITRALIQYLQSSERVSLFLGNQVEDLCQTKDGIWEIEIEDRSNRKKTKVSARFVFIGAGGGSLPLLEKSDIPEGRGYGGFPVSGQWMRCDNPKIIARHEAKVYGKADEGSPPMSVPHLDTRYIGAKQALLFGPYAGFSTKFLKNGSYFDLPLSLEVHNIWPLISAGFHNFKLTKYLIRQVFQSDDDRFEAIKKYYPTAKKEDWKLAIAGQRVQIIKKDKEEGGVLQFGTEIVCAQDKSLAALLGASPGASTAVSIMLDLLNQCFSQEMQSDAVKNKLVQIIPSYGQSLIQNGNLCREVRKRTARILELIDTKRYSSSS